MPNTRILREIVATLRRLTARAEEADAPVARDVLSMSAGVVGSVERGAERQERATRPEAVTRRLGEP